LNGFKSCRGLKYVTVSDAASFEHQEVALETIVHLCEEPTFVVDMYINYDCDLNCGNMFEKLVEFLYKNSYPVTGAPHNIHLLALEGLIAILDSVNLRINNPPPTGNVRSISGFLKSNLF
jgi:brefeldin A-resistance guanine nucleotide exchange factor 1